MIPPLQAVPEEELPTFALFKNLVLEDPMTGPATDIVSFDWVKVNSRPEPLEREVPTPAVPTDPGRIERMRESERFEDMIDPGTGGVLEEELKYSLVDWHLSEEPSDADVFGESYTLVWLCRPDVGIAVEALVQAARENAGGKRMNEFTLSDLWTEYLDRILLYPSGSLADNEIWHLIREGLEQRLRTLPEAPKESDWDEFQRYL